jgi:hypothetical protein
MAGTVKHARLESRTARSRLKRGRQPHWQALEPGRVHLGWQCWKGDPAGRWVLRRYIGNRKYRTTALGLADDAAEANFQAVSQRPGQDDRRAVTARRLLRLYLLGPLQGFERLSFLIALLEQRFEFLFERSRQNAELAKTRQLV